MMTGDLESSNTVTNIASIKNAWVMCKSKSHPGHNYYFNYLTRESKWDLSESEKEKVESKILSPAELDKCLEPNIPPGQDFPRTSNIYNKQIIPQLPEMYNMHGIPGSSGLDTNIWQTPPNLSNSTYIIVPGALLPTIAPFINQAAVSYGIQQPNEYAQNPNRNIPSNTFNRAQRGLKHNSIRGSYKKQFTHYNNSKMHDLRQKITRKRRNSSYNMDTWNEQDFKASNEKKDDYDHSSNSWNTDGLHESPSKYDLSKVKQLSLPDSESRNWLVVVDLDILLTEFPFLNRLTDPEQNCYLMVPDHVLLELHDRASSDDNKNIKRIDRFLTEQIQSELAYRGEDVSNRAEDDCEKTFLTCTDWADGNNIILLSNNTKFNKYKNSIHNIHIFTINELKYLLEFGPAKHGVTAAAKPLSVREIKITVPNNTHETSMKELSPSTSTSPVTKSDSLKVPVVNRHINYESIEEVTPKHVTQSSVKETISLGDDNIIIGATDQTKEAECNIRNDLSASNNSTKQIKLNRGDTTSADGSSKQTKPLKRWRRRPLISNNSTWSCATKNDVDSSQGHVDETNEKLKTPPIQGDSIDTASNLSKTSKTSAMHKGDMNIEHSKISIMTRDHMDNESNASKASKSSTMPRGNANTVCNASKTSKEPRDHIDTESIASKTSRTSTMLRNHNVSTDCDINEAHLRTASSMARESSERGSISSPKKTPARDLETSLSPVSKNTSNSDSNGRYKEKMLKITAAVMYKVQSPEMEEVLRTGRDEWVTRFIQIMEEVLRQKLLDHSALYLRDAVTCIIGKYSNHFSVVDAANRLAFILYQLTDDTGNIKSNVEPSEFMEMYSYGVYLVEKLKDVSDNCEDLNAADVSLKKILFDINHSNLHSSQETFTEEQHINEANLSATSLGQEETPQINDISDCTIYEDDFNQSRSTCGDPRPFFEITNNQNDNGRPEASDDGSIENGNSDSFSHKNPQTLPKMHSDVEKATSAENEPTDTATDNINKPGNSIQPVIARRFFNIPQFEEKIKKKNNFTIDQDEKRQNERIDNNEVKKPEVDDVQKDVHDEGTQDKINDDKTPDKIMTNDDKFKTFIEEFVGEIRAVFQKVLVLEYEIMSAVRHRNESIQATIEKAEIAAPMLCNISVSLERILYRESNDENLSHLLKIANMENYVPSKRILLKYTEIISEFKNQADRLYKYLTQMIEIYKSV